MADELGRWLGEIRPSTEADAGWATSADGDAALNAIHRAAADSGVGRRTTVWRSASPRTRSTVRWGGRIAVLGAAAAVGAVLVAPGGAHRPPIAGGTAPITAAPAHMSLVSYSGCGDLLQGLRTHTAQHINQIALPTIYNGAYAGAGSVPMFDTMKDAPPLSNERAPAAAGPDAAAQASAPAASDHSATNVQEAGVDEPDLVKTDGSRIVTVAGGVLRVVDAQSRQVTGSLNLGANDYSQPVNLLLDGDRVLVFLGQRAMPVPVQRGSAPYTPPAVTSGFALVDIAGAPKLVARFEPRGLYLDARMVGNTVRVVVNSTPHIALSTWRPGMTEQEMHKRNVWATDRSPLASWQPAYTVTRGNTSVSTQVPCSSVSHAADYTGTSMLTVYTVDMHGNLSDLAPVSIAADGSTVYATAESLYVTSAPASYCCTYFATDMPQGGFVALPGKAAPIQANTEIHRFDIKGTGAPRYLGSGSVPGFLLSQYSLSDFEGYLRIASTTWTNGGQQSGVHVLDLNTLKEVGTVDGLGKGQRVYAVRFAGQTAYVVTFRQLDPLYVLDLSNPRAPKQAGQLELTGYSAYLHPISGGRLIGIGQEADSNGRIAGLQISLFDVSNPQAPRRVAQTVRTDALSEDAFDPHAFLYWDKTGLVVVPLSSWTGNSPARAVGVRVDDKNLDTVGDITQPGGIDTGGLERSLVVDGSVWTMSQQGLQVNDLTTLAKQAWVPFS